MTFHAMDWTIKQGISQNKYTGIIVGIADPNKDNRAQVRIPFLHAGVPDEMLPWFKNGNIPDNVEGKTTIRLPILGATVRVEFENGDMYTGTFYSGYKGIQNNDEEFLEDYGTFNGEKDQWGNLYKVYNNGNVLCITNQGVTLQISGTELVISGLTKTTYNSDVVQINAGTSFTVTSPNIKLDGTTDIVGDTTIESDNLYMGGKNNNSSHTHTGNLGSPTSGIN